MGSVDKSDDKDSLVPEEHKGFTNLHITGLRRLALDTKALGHGVVSITASELHFLCDMAAKAFVPECGTSPTPRAFHVCADHRNAEWNQPQLDSDDCVLCTLFYLEAQESLLEEWQQRAKRAEEALSEVKRPLEEQMARLNDTVTRLNEENDRLRSARSASGTLPVPEGMKCVPTKPTPRMLEIGYEKAAFPRDPEIAAAMWAAMVEAAPTLPYAVSTSGITEATLLPGLRWAKNYFDQAYEKEAGMGETLDNFERLIAEIETRSAKGKR